MSTNEKSVSIETTPAGTHTETAQMRVEELRRWREQIPRFAIPPAADATRRLASAGSVPAIFIELTNVALAKQTTLVRAEGATPAQVRDMVGYAEAYAPLADELEALAHFVRYSVMAARNAAGNEALTTYSLAQRMSKLPQFAYLKPYVADMRRALGRGRKLTPEEAERKAAERTAKAAEKAAAKVAARAAKLTPPPS